MATYFARKSGNINASDVWATTPSGTAGAVVFTSSDILLSNTFTITVNVNTTVAEIRNDTTGGATAGGTFELSNAITLTSNVFGNGLTNGVCVNLAAGIASGAIVGNITGGSLTNSIGARNNSTGTLTITGSVTGGSASGAGAYGVVNSQTGTINITGSITGGSVNTNYGVHNNSTGTINITGSVNGGVAGNCSGVNNAVGGTVSITGNVTGGSNSTGYGVYNTGTGIITISGTATGGTVAIAAYNNGSGTLIVTRAKGNGYGNGSVGLSSAVGVFGSQNGSTNIYEIEYGDLGQSPTSGAIILLNATSNVALFYRTSGGKKTLVDSSAAADYPAISNVRSGTVYGNTNFTGTLAVPSASSVAFGVAVDNTTGTAVLTPANVWNYLTSNIATSGSIGERMKNCSTIASVGQQLVDSLNAI
jgi:hypothetical protein